MLSCNQHVAWEVAVSPKKKISKKSLKMLEEQGNELLARMQTPKARRGMREAFDASPKELAKAALKYARKERRKKGKP
jgi:hypothetical protein